MTPEEFVNETRRLVLAENLSIYKDLFTSTDTNQAKDPYWARALQLHAALNDDQRKVLFEIIRQVMVDSISNVFAILDGVALDSQEEELSLSTGATQEILNGDLQDMFLELEEGR